MSKEYVVSGHGGANVMDTADQDLIRIRLPGDTYDRVQLDASGLSTDPAA